METKIVLIPSNRACKIIKFVDRRYNLEEFEEFHKNFGHYANSETALLVEMDAMEYSKLIPE